MNQTSTDNDLQKAIDDITNTTNSDPVFADPVAAPSSVPEGDTGELAESVGPFPAPKPMPIPPQPIAAPKPAIDLATAIADFSVPSIQPVPMDDQPALANEPTPEKTQPAPAKAQPVADTAVFEEATTTTTTNPAGLSIHEVKTAALRDLAPLVGKMDLPPSQKFSIYRDMFENLRDYTVIEQAYQSAKDIADEKERAEALLYLVQAIDNM